MWLICFSRIIPSFIIAYVWPCYWLLNSLEQFIESLSKECCSSIHVSAPSHICWCLLQSSLYSPACHNPSLVSGFISFQTCNVYFPEKICFFRVVDGLYKNIFLIQMSSSEGHVKGRRYWAPAERFSLLMDLRTACWQCGEWPWPSSAPPKAPVKSQTLPRIHTVKDFWMSTGPIPCPSKAGPV